MVGLHKGSGCDQHHSLGSTLLTLLFPSSQGFSRITPQLYERHLSPQPQHYKKTRKANPPFAHLREAPALLLSLRGCCQPFHTSHSYSFLLGACSHPRDHQDASVVTGSHHKDVQLDHEYCTGSNTSFLSRRSSTSLVSQFPMSPCALKDKKLHKLFCWRFFFCKGSNFCCPSALSQDIAQCFLYYKKVCIRQEEKNFLRRLMCIIVCN